MATQNPTNDGTPTDGANPYVDSLVWGSASWASSPADPILYWFGEGTAPGPDGGTVTGNIWSPDERAALVAALDNYAAVANLYFAPAASHAAADIVEWIVPSGAWTDPPLGEHAVPVGPANGQINGWYNYQTDYWSYMTPGGGGYNLLLHELGHGMGLAHPHDGGSRPDRNVFPGVTSSTSTGTNQLNQGIWTVMSYVDGWPAVEPREGSAYGHAKTLMAFDIAALQAIYGANISYRTGDDAYVIDTTNDTGTGWAAIWDAGGTDLITNEGSSLDVTIDLRAAPLDGSVNAAGYVSRGAGIKGGFVIANGVTIENASGGSGYDTITGNSAANVLNGNPGNDSIYGGDGNDNIDGGLDLDFLFGDAGNDTLRGDLGLDNLYGGADDDTLFGGNGDDQLFGGDGNDSIDGGLDQDTAYGDAGNDTLRGDLGRDTLYGGADADTLYGGIHDDELVGGAGADYIDGQEDKNYATYRDSPSLVTIDLNVAMQSGGDAQGDTLVNIADIGGSLNWGDDLTGNAQNNYIAGFGGGDTIRGGNGDDQLVGGTGDDSLDGGWDQDTLFADEGNDTLRGDLGRDTLYGGADSDNLYGGIHDDELVGGAGADYIDGQEDKNYATYRDSPSFVTIDLNVAVQSGGDAQGDTLVNIADIGGSLNWGDDLTGNAQNNYIAGFGGNDTIRGGAGQDLLVGGAENDSIFGGADGDAAYGDNGNDTLNGEDGDDIFYATHDDGNDVITGGIGFDILDFSAVNGVVQINQLAGTVTGSAGNDTLLDVIEQIKGTAYGDVLSGGHGINVLDGEGGDDQFFGNNGDDLMRGGTGGDTFYFSLNDGNDRLLGGDGFDILDYSSLGGVVQVNQLDGTTTGSANNDTLLDVFEMVIGTQFGDVLSGGHGINSLKGNGGDDQIFANNGDDYTSGGDGNDTITMGVGNDTHDFRNGEDIDTILDFTAGGTDDTITLTYYSGLGISNFAQLQASGRLSTVSGHAELALNGGDRIIFQNVASHTSLTAADFVFV